MTGEGVYQWPVGACVVKMGKRSPIPVSTRDAYGTCLEYCERYRALTGDAATIRDASCRRGCKAVFDGIVEEGEELVGPGIVPARKRRSGSSTTDDPWWVLSLPIALCVVVVSSVLAVNRKR